MCELFEPITCLYCNYTQSGNFFIGPLIVSRGYRRYLQALRYVHWCLQKHLPNHDTDTLSGCPSRWFYSSEQVLKLEPSTIKVHTAYHIGLLIDNYFPNFSVAGRTSVISEPYEPTIVGFILLSSQTWTVYHQSAYRVSLTTYGNA
jgi:hypothetical protein